MSGDGMELLVLPVSGGRMFGQLGALQRLTDVGYVPDIILSSSGGNFAAYIAMAAQWQFHAISRITSMLTPSLFLTPWINIGFLDSIVGFFSGFIYNKGKGTYELMQTIFTEETIKSCEIWTGFYNCKNQRTRFGCNKKKTLLNPSYIDRGLSQIMKIYYPKTIREITDLCIASASIPAIVPPQLIEGDYYEDGGISSASPLTFMKEPIRRLGQRLHLTYINTFNFSEPNIEETINVVDSLKNATSALIRSSTLTDLLSGQDVLLFYSNNTSHIESITFPCTTFNLDIIKRVKKVLDRSFLEIYPNWDMDIDITSFTPTQTLETLDESYHNSTCCFRYIHGCDEVEGLLKEIKR
jgi:Patatin-like phospholipase